MVVCPYVIIFDYILKVFQMYLNLFDFEVKEYIAVVSMFTFIFTGVAMVQL